MSIRMVFPHMYNDSSGKHMCVQTFRSVRRDVKNIVPSAVRTDSVLNDQTSPRGKFRDRNRWEPCGTNWQLGGCCCRAHLLVRWRVYAFHVLSAYISHTSSIKIIPSVGRLVEKTATKDGYERQLLGLLEPSGNCWALTTERLTRENFLGDLLVWLAITANRWFLRVHVRISRTRRLRVSHEGPTRASRQRRKRDWETGAASRVDCVRVKSQVVTIVAQR